MVFAQEMLCSGYAYPQELVNVLVASRSGSGTRGFLASGTALSNRYLVGVNVDLTMKALVVIRIGQLTREMYCYLFSINQKSP